MKLHESIEIEGQMYEYVSGGNVRSHFESDDQRLNNLAVTAIGMNFLKGLVNEGRVKEVSQLIQEIAKESSVFAVGVGKNLSQTGIFGASFSEEIGLLVGVASISGIVDGILAKKNGEVNNFRGWVEESVKSGFVEMFQMSVPYLGVLAAKNFWTPTTDWESVLRTGIIAAGYTGVVLGAIPDRALGSRRKIGDWCAMVTELAFLEAAEIIPPVVRRVVGGPDR